MNTSLGRCVVIFFLALGVGSSAFIIAEEKAAPKRIEKNTALINQLLDKQWQESMLTPAKKTSDLEFLRRVSVQLIGRIPTLEEIAAFEKDNRADKRARSVDSLLASDEYADNFARLWTRWLFAGSVYPPTYREQTQRWLKEQFTANISHTELATRLITATGKSSENPAVHFVLAHLGEPIPADKRSEEGQFDMTPMAPRAATVFLGNQIQCTQCHDHPFNADWKQKHFWGMNAFFRQVERIGEPPDRIALATMGCTPAGTVMDRKGQSADQARTRNLPVLELRDNPDFNPKGLVFYERRCGVVNVTGPIFLDGRKMRRNHAGTRREEFARLVTSNSNFGKALVNRMWGVLFSRGMHYRPQVDDFGEHNEIVHPELLDQLAKATADAGYDVKQLIRWICASDAYQLQCTFNATNEADEMEALFSRMPLRPMGFDQMFESVWTATGMGSVLGKHEKKNLRDEWRRFLHLEFDDDQAFSPPVGDIWLQMMLVMNNRDIHDAIGDRAGTLGLALKRQRPAEIAETLYLATLTRRPTAAELAVIEQEIRKERKRSPNADLLPFWQDLFWALLNTNEFSINH